MSLSVSNACVQLIYFIQNNAQVSQNRCSNDEICGYSLTVEIGLKYLLTSD
jgi:hypothetical protein